MCVCRCRRVFVFAQRALYFHFRIGIKFRLNRAHIVPIKSEITWHTIAINTRKLTHYRCFVSQACFSCAATLFIIEMSVCFKINIRLCLAC